MTMEERYSRAPSTADSRRVFYVRLLTASVQAALLYALLRIGSDEDAIKHTWQSAHPQFYVPLLLAAVYAPCALLLGAGQMRVRPLILWTLIVALAAAGLGYHDAMRGGQYAHDYMNGLPLPWFRLWLVMTAAGFVGQVLITDGYGNDAPIVIDATETANAAASAPTLASAPAAATHALRSYYARHFNTAWRMGLQIVLAFVFIGVFWLVLQLGATLFSTIGLPGPERIIRELGFILPACTLAFAIAIHLTSVQSSLIRGLRLLVLTLFSWLLPLLAIIVAAFLVSLIIQSVQPLWDTRYAASLLLSSAALMVFLINACYQDGSPEQEGQRLRRWAAMLGAVELLPLVGLAAWALQLRVRQYGWTVDRIVAAAVCVQAAWYALGYASSLVRSRGWMQRVEATNISAAYLFLVLVAALFSPLAEPARLMVADQVARLQSGATDPAKFDYSALYQDGGHWGLDALNDLAANATGPSAATIKEQAQHALNSYVFNRDYVYRDPDAALLAKTVDVLPAGRSLPETFLKKDIWTKVAWGLPTCAYDEQTRCTARFITLAPGEPEAMIFAEASQRYLFQPDAQGTWQLLGSLEDSRSCGVVTNKIKHGEIRPVPPALPDLMVDDQRLRIVPRDQPCVDTATRDVQ
ncbi:hypothetical protein CEY04_29625 [Achromobacter sp. HZ28]|nr:hypothetical protein CEY04_29625 [Achromobacter sp. HZ28]OWT78492.1 hypothetical protein CEY05_11425 [Achromobacter sp. HZ34]